MLAPPMRRFRLLAIFAALTVLGVLMLSLFARSVLYPNPPVTVPSPPPGGIEEVRLPLPTGGRAVAWTVRPSALPDGAPVAVFFHGNGENLETMRRSGLFARLRHLPAISLAVDYPGYGRSEGSPGEKSILASGEAAVAWAREQHPERPVVLVGWSLGAAAAAATAADGDGTESIAGIALLSPWTRLADVAAVHFPRFLVRWAVRERYDSLDAARRVAARGIPTLVIHGERDTIIPAEQGGRIAEALREAGAESGAPTRWLPIPVAGHNDLLSYPEVWDALDRFLVQTARKRPEEAAGA